MGEELLHSGSVVGGCETSGDDVLDSGILDAFPSFRENAVDDVLIDESDIGTLFVGPILCEHFHHAHAKGVDIYFGVVLLLI